MITASRITVTDEPTALVTGPEALSDPSIRLHNTDETDSVYLGPAAVTTTTGFELAKGQIVEIKLEDGDTLYAVAAESGSIEVCVLVT